MMPDGTIRIVDRKKDLVKLQGGEYVSLGKVLHHEVLQLLNHPVEQVESLLKLHPVVENLCLYADPSRTFPVALVIPAQGWLDQVYKIKDEDHNCFRSSFTMSLCKHSLDYFLLRCVPSWARLVWSGRRRAWTRTWWRT